MPPSRPVVLVVLDGFGYREEREGNAIALARTPTWTRLWEGLPRTLLHASGRAVGLPAGQMGNSEVGHLNLGAGRVVKQDLVRITEAIEDGSFYTRPAFLDTCARLRESGGTLHLMGLLGNGGVHALDQHLFALLELAERERVPRVVIHALMDGRDTMPTSGLGFMRRTVEEARKRGARVASLGGRYFGMDRDKRWERVRRWYDASVRGVGPAATDPVAAIQSAYERGETDEFITPVAIVEEGRPIAPMRDGDAVICWNYRSDRMRQIVRALMDPDFQGFDVSDRPALSLATMTSYNETFTFPVAFPPFSMARIVAEVVSGAGLTMFRTAETEKYPHVTYFFNGGIEAPFAGEERLLVPSPKVPTYDLQPEMSAAGVTEVLCRSIEAGSYDFTLCNYANCDMVGHTGVLPAVIRAVETVDACLSRVVQSAERAGARLLITADHGNCELMIDPETGGPHTAHTTNPVPLVIRDPDGDRPLRDGGALCDVGPTILAMLGLERPGEMTGRDLRVALD
ncbi:MAG TPA: 2,3-bisphosphoglycerate-independent phosphoglycerate mutase [Gemmatimonadaceae bacterium]|nr:2,3-bisphosphoglycerate-independent phosphoglycerate mutase [Gemmatimonadaceae bacterium]